MGNTGVNSFGHRVKKRYEHQKKKCVIVKNLTETKNKTANKFTPRTATGKEEKKNRISVLEEGQKSL